MQKNKIKIEIIVITFIHCVNCSFDERICMKKEEKIKKMLNILKILCFFKINGCEKFKSRGRGNFEIRKQDFSDCLLVFLIQSFEINFEIVDFKL